MESGAGTAADWVAVETRQVRREARADLRLAPGERLLGGIGVSGGSVEDDIIIVKAALRAGRED